MDKIEPGGIFFSLPREIRDEIYRYLLKGHHLFYQSAVDYKSMTPTAVLTTAYENPTFAIFLVSKATYNEATSIFYLESVFRYYIDLIDSSVTYPPGPATNRMMKIEFEFNRLSPYGPWYSPYPDGIEHNLQATLDKFTGLSSLRNTMFIKFPLGSLDFSRTMSTHLFRRLKALVSFRTVIVHLAPAPGISRIITNGEWYKRLAQDIEREMVPTMGPATVSQVDHNYYLEFHPLDHMRANLGAQAEKLQMEMDKLNSGTDRLEEGN